MFAFLRDPLVRFLGVGALLFAAASVTPASTDDAPEARTIVVPPAIVEALATELRGQGGAQPDAAALAARLAEWVDEEIAVREAIARGLDRGDPVIRRRLVQKLGFVLEDGVATAAVTDADIAALLAASPERYRVDAIVSLRHVFVPFEPGVDARALAEAHARELRALDADAAAGAPTPSDAAATPGALAARGAPFVHGAEQRELSLRALRKRFGPSFVEAIEEAGTSAHAAAALAAEAPVAVDWFVAPSSYGWHAVRIDGFTPGRGQRIDEARAAARVAIEAERRSAAAAAARAQLRASYRVALPDGAPPLPPPTPAIPGASPQRGATTGASPP